MYVTRRLSKILEDYPESISALPDGPNTGFLVLQENFISNIRNLPFPQNVDLKFSYRERVTNDPMNKNEYETVSYSVIFIPVLNQPLYYNRYYAIVPDGMSKGKAMHASNQSSRTFNPTDFDPRNVYQQVQIEENLRCPGKYKAISAAVDGFCPYYLSKCTGEWSLHVTRPDHFKLEDAIGVNSKLRARFLSLSLVKPVVVGRWYVPFMFVKEGRVRDQVERSLYYLVTLEQRWEKVFSCKKNENGGGNIVRVDVGLLKQDVYIAGHKALWSEKNADDGVVWFSSYEMIGGSLSVGLRVEVLDRMKWEQERGGWQRGENERKGKVERVEEFKGGEGEDWEEFGCYVLVERFSLRRMDESVAMVYDFKHIHQIKTVWE